MCQVSIISLWQGILIFASDKHLYVHKLTFTKGSISLLLFYLSLINYQLYVNICGTRVYGLMFKITTSVSPYKKLFCKKIYFAQQLWNKLPMDIHASRTIIICRKCKDSPVQQYFNFIYSLSRWTDGTQHLIRSSE